MNILPIAILLGALLITSVSISAEPDSALIEREVMAVLDDFMTSFSGRDPVGHAETYHFPHFRLAGGVMRSWPTAEDAIRDHEALFKTLPATGWYKSVWLDRQIITLSDTKVHVNTRFQRLRADGSEIGAYNSLYVLIKQDGRWGIKMRSSFL